MVDSIYTQVAYAPSEANGDTKLSEEGADKEFSFFGDDGFSFLDFVDMVNPLQHIPVVSTAYRQLTGDEIDPGSRLAGGTLFGGPVGLAMSAFNVLLEQNTGKDAGEHVVAWFDGEEEPMENPTMMANRNPNQPHPAVSSFAPLPAANIPASEAEAFAAGEASLRLAQLQEFMNPTQATEIPMTEAQKGAGSAGTWTPPLNQEHPFPTERPGAGSAMPREMTSFFQRSPQPVAEVAQAEMTPKPVPVQQQAPQFQSKQSYEDSSLAALQAFARDVKAQRQQEQTQEVKQEMVAPKPVPSNTAQLSQTQDNAWFAQMMNQNMDRYRQANQPKG
ncbi:hypothetical protein [Terasakiella sp. SH-1]|uniref:hypothetical protein n=1 Tax=Terasakiella sp. SH-1 TaxID=2560057 RepID=UPI001073702C|nr:hypothetical protein [Terasakiella sp. SH-1]